MAKPVIEKISDEVVSRLRNITIANGYEFTIVAADLVKRETNTWTPQALKIKVEYGEIAENETYSYPGNPPRVAYDAEFVISGYSRDIDVDESEVGMTDASVTDTQMIAAIQKALANNDATAWHTFGGNSILASIVSASTFDAPGYDGGQVKLVVTYRTSEVSPFA